MKPATHLESSFAHAQGIETVRRDNCLLVKNVVTTCLEKILMESDVIGAEVYVKGVISDLLMNRVDLSLLVISKVSDGAKDIVIDQGLRCFAEGGWEVVWIVRFRKVGVAGFLEVGVGCCLAVGVWEDFLHGFRVSVALFLLASKRRHHRTEQLCGWSYMVTHLASLHCADS